MSLISCQKCGKETSSDSKKCVHCGHKLKIKKPVNRKAILISCLTLCIIMIVIGITVFSIYITKDNSEYSYDWNYWDYALGIFEDISGERQSWFNDNTIQRLSFTPYVWKTSDLPASAWAEFNFKLIDADYEISAELSIDPIQPPALSYYFDGGDYMQSWNVEYKCDNGNWYSWFDTFSSNSELAYYQKKLTDTTLEIFANVFEDELNGYCDINDIIGEFDNFNNYVINTQIAAFTSSGILFFGGIIGCLTIIIVLAVKKRKSKQNPQSRTTNNSITDTTTK